MYTRGNAHAGIRRWEPVRQIRYLWFHSIFPNYHLAADRLDMAHGVEVRLPFLDHELFEYGNSLPIGFVAGGQENGGDQTKWLLREAARPWLAPGILGRTKQPFWAPPSATRQGSRLHELVQDTLRSELVAATGIFDARGVVRLLDSTRAADAAARAPLDPLLMMIASFCMLEERMGMRDGCDGSVSAVA
jgi:asparagine synthase (glutamine-hydrolysing)